MKIGSIVKVPRSHFKGDYEDNVNLVIKITKIIEGNHIQGIVLKNAPNSWKKNTTVYFYKTEIVTSEIKIKEVVNFT